MIKTNETPSCPLLIEKATIKRKEQLLLYSSVILSLIIHSFFVVEGFGEQDAARLAFTAQLWHDADIFVNNYIYRVSPLYLYILKLYLILNFPLSSIDVFMNWSSVLIGSLSLIPIFFLYKKLVNSETAFMGCLLYSFTPAFWLANTYGMPLIHAFFFFLISLCIFISCLSDRTFKFYVHIFLAAMFACLAVNFKADIILCFGIFLGIVFYQREYSFRNFASSLLIPAVSLLSVFVLSKSLFPSIDAPLSEPRNWIETFPLTLRAVTDWNNFLVLPRSVGRWMFLGIAMALVVCIFEKKYRPNLLLIILGSAPTFVFWGLRMGNSARHMMVAYLFLIFMLSFVLFEITKKFKYWPFVFIFLIVINYFSNQPSGDTRRPSSQIFSTNNLIDNKTSSLYEFTGNFYNLPYPKKMYIGNWEIPYVKWQMYLMASKVEYIQTEKGLHFRLFDTEKGLHFRLFDEDGVSQEVKFKYVWGGLDGDSFGPIPDWYLATINKSLEVLN